MSDYYSNRRPSGYPSGSRRRRSRRKKTSIMTVIGTIFLMMVLCGVILASLVLMRRDMDIQDPGQLREEIFSVLTVQKQTAEAEVERIRAEEAERLAIEEEQRRIAQEEEEKRRKEEEARLAEEKLLKEHPELAAEITYTLPSGDQVLDRSVIETWLTDNGDGTYTRDEEKWMRHIADYVDQMAKITDSVGVNRLFGTTGLGEYTIAGSSYYGWEIDEASEAEALNQALLSGYQGTREPIYLSREAAKTDDNYGVGGDYVEIDLSRQHLWVYRDYTCVLETDIVSGLMDERHYTPEGIFWMITRETNATLKGEQLPNNTFSYEVPVAYWMKLTDDGVGLHDADWKWAFGGEEYIWNGSHGCVNLPVDMAGEIFNLTSYDTPVVMYYSQPYELRPAPPSDLDNYLAALAAKLAEEEDEDDEDEEDEEDENGEENPDGSVTNPDGSVTHPDGTITHPDGTVTNPDGSVTSPDGTVTNPDESVTNPDGSVFYPDGSVVYADGTVVYSDGTTVYPDGTVVYPQTGAEGGYSASPDANTDGQSAEGQDPSAGYYDEFGNYIGG